MWHTSDCCEILISRESLFKPAHVHNMLNILSDDDSHSTNQGLEAGQVLTRLYISVDAPPSIPSPFIPPPMFLSLSINMLHRGEGAWEEVVLITVSIKHHLSIAGCLSLGNKAKIKSNSNERIGTI